jgi:predicted nucleic acid-binding protein
MPSASTVFVDTNVLLYAVDPRDAGKQAAAQSWLRRCWADDCGRLSTQVLHELYANLRRIAPRLDVDAARGMVRRYRAWRPWLVDAETVDAAWDVQDRYGLHYWDALMVASAQHQGCAYFLSEDLQHEQVLDNVRVIDPFRVGPDLLDRPPAP